jgi:LEA14-like dessication related protein
MVKNSLWIVLILLLFGCKSLEPPEFKYIEDLKIEMLDQGNAILKANAVLHNPNKKNIVIKRIDIDLYADEKVIATIDKDMSVKAKGASDFRVPLDIQVSLGDLNLNNIGAALGLFGSGGQKVRYLGKIKVKAYGVPLTVPVDYEDKIKFSL